MSEPRFTRHIRREFERVDDLQDAARAAREVVSSPGWLVIESILSAELNGLDREMDDPRRVLDQATYAARHAYRAGLRSVQEIVETLEETAAARLADEQARHEGVAAEPARR